MRQQTVKSKLDAFSVSLRTIGTLVLLICLFGLWLYGGQSTQPSQHAAIIENDELLALAAESQPNPDIYASSLVKPGSPLFKGLYELQSLRKDLAEKALLPLAEAGNSDAMYWYGMTVLRSSVLSGGDKWIHEAAIAGNPYAMRRLVPAGETLQDCEWYLGSYCDDAWADKAQEAFQQRLQANPDDVLSRYAASMDVDRAAEAAKQKYYAPMVSLAHKYGKAYEAGELSEADTAKVVALLKMAANDNFAPALVMLSTSFRKFLGKDKSLFYAKKALMLGYNSIDTIYWGYQGDYKQVRERGNLLLSLPYALIFRDYFRDDTYWRLIKHDLKKMNLPLTEAEISAAKEQAEKIISEITPVIYIDAIYDVEAYH
ncbi:hypothetical protein [Shewanella algae]|uniref:hypothetical protein n=1 Tax=Shewanella algae TaxID=38313 RepID=UPI001186EE3B|nr:hypothetical protein [Shewanella algae]MBO2686643.1 hypothetical protein [Shewanella algae]QHD52436.1 hypothetical protein GM320_04250 [Shewanella algae]BCV39566.1 hypothetical protein TUM17378_08280 [Shewanella algae]